MDRSICLAVGWLVIGCASSQKPAPVEASGANPNGAEPTTTEPVTETASLSLSEVEEQWHRLIDEEKTDEARAYCEGLLKREEKPVLAEAHKCLANVELMGAQVVVLDHNEEGVAMRDGYEDTAAGRAVAHLDQAAGLAPQDLSIHQGRLHILLRAGLIARFIVALEDSCNKYEAENELDEWLPYVSELINAGDYDSSLAVLSVLDKQYPGSHKVIANMGAVHGMTDNMEKALALTEKAVALAPGDPLNTWNLGRLYELSEKFDKARELYEKSITFEADPETKIRKHCMLGQFLVETKTDKKAGCAVTAEHCPAPVKGCE